VRIPASGRTWPASPEIGEEIDLPSLSEGLRAMSALTHAAEQANA